jgi:hypothetical protein
MVSNTCPQNEGGRIKFNEGYVGTELHDVIIIYFLDFNLIP